MTITIYLASISSSEDLFTTLLNEHFHIDEPNCLLLYQNTIKPHIDRLDPDTYLLAETNYTDKVYRDSYYHYYSSKLRNYKRDCVRISLFQGEISDTDFRNPDKYDDLQKAYRGFFVLRPTDPFIMGRSIISPLALSTHEFASCTCTFKATANGLKFTVDGFPHSSQDTETMSCAETTLWAVMEYFGNKYGDYSPVSPSKIIKTLNKVSAERQVPSKGLNIQQMSFALKEFGFATRIYSEPQYGKEFPALLSCYIESGIPLIIAMQNTHKGGSIGHALLVVGHEKVDEGNIDTLAPYGVYAPKNITFYDYDYIDKKFAFIDDNQPAYQLASLGAPAVHYSNAEWHSCDITHFIAPLYPKIYLEAYEVKKYVPEFLIIGPEPLSDNSEVLIRYYLASSRSFKDHLAKDTSISEELKELILEQPLPKFVWLAELSTKDLIKQKMANGLIILDATEANIYSNKPLILAAYQDKLLVPDKTTGTIENNSLPSHTFKIFEQNLTSFEI